MTRLDFRPPDQYVRFQGAPGQVVTCTVEWTGSPDKSANTYRAYRRRSRGGVVVEDLPVDASGAATGTVTFDMDLSDLEGTYDISFTEQEPSLTERELFGGDLEVDEVRYGSGVWDATVTIQPNSVGVPVTLTIGAATPSVALDDLTDVTAPAPASGDGLVWNGTAWVNLDVATQAELNTHTGATGTAVHGLGTASTHNVPASGNAAAGEVVKGDDTRLTDNRTDPTKVAKAGDTMTGALTVGSLRTVTVATDGSITYRYDSTHYTTVAHDGILSIVGSPNTALIQGSLATDSATRVELDVDGHLQIGDGTNPCDTNLYRDSAAVLRTDGEFRANKIDGGTP